MQVGTESKARTNTVDENMALWKEMLAGSTRGQECCARFKMDMVRTILLRILNWIQGWYDAKPTHQLIQILTEGRARMW